jgi:hypothetical protein
MDFVGDFLSLTLRPKVARGLPKVFWGRNQIPSKSLPPKTTGHRETCRRNGRIYSAGVAARWAAKFRDRQATGRRVWNRVPYEELKLPADGGGRHDCQAHGATTVADERTGDIAGVLANGAAGRAWEPAIPHASGGAGGKGRR